MNVSLRHLLHSGLAVTALAVCTCLSIASAADSNQTHNNAGNDKSSSGTGSSPNDSLPATDPSYKLSAGDDISIQVYGEGDMSTAQRIDNKGVVRIPYAGELAIGDKTVREAEAFLEKSFFEKKLLRRPMVSITVREYALRQVSVLGAVNSPGKFRLPRESANIEIVELITSLGGFRPTARSSEVKVTHTDDAGNETVTTVDVESMINGRKSAAKSFLVYPGDRLFVPERLF